MSLFENITSWWADRYSMFIMVRPGTSEVMLSKKLFEQILSEHEEKQISVMFTRISNSIDGKNGKAVSSNVTSYAMFFNPEFDKHGIRDPRSILTVPVTIGKLGHIGFQAIQPSVSEIMAVYGLPARRGDNALYRIKVTRSILNEEPYYILER